MHPCRSFTRAFQKVILRKDVDNLGFKGEICFVKPGFALNYLIPQRLALFHSDPAVLAIKTDLAELKTKQEIRSLELFLSKLKDIKLIFNREVSEINKNVSKIPVDP
jgi:large subunit ribosomal protein L9